MRRLCLLLIIFYYCANVKAQYKGLYVDGFDLILGNQLKEDSLLTYAHNHHFTALTLYGMGNVNDAHNLTVEASAQIFTNFVIKAKNLYNVQQVSVVAENFAKFANVYSLYNQLHPADSERIDVYNLEFEFWNGWEVDTGSDYCSSYLMPNGYACTIDGAYAWYITQLKSIDSLAHVDGSIGETYVGWPDSLQAVGMLPFADRILVHAYVTDPSIAYGYTSTRLSYFGSTTDTAKLAIIFSSEPDFLGPWLASNSADTVMPIYLSDYNADVQPWKSQINLLGQQWFDYTDMPYVLDTAVDSPTVVRLLNQPQSILLKNDNTHIYLSSNGYQGPATLVIYDMNAKTVQKEELQIGKETISVLLKIKVTGMYAAMVEDQHHDIIAKKMLNIVQ